MELKELLKKQKELDDFIINNKQLKYMDKNVLLGNAITALMVESAELANEVRHFKHWSDKGITVKNAKEEYVDCLHFILSIGNMLFNDAEEIEEFYKTKYNENIRRQKEGY